MSQREGFGTFLLRVWMWAVPVLIMIASLVFGVIAAADGTWGLLFVMVVMFLTGAGLFLLHWWLMYRFGGLKSEE